MVIFKLIFVFGTKFLILCSACNQYAQIIKFAKKILKIYYHRDNKMARPYMALSQMP